MSLAMFDAAMRTEKGIFFKTTIGTEVRFDEFNDLSDSDKSNIKLASVKFERLIPYGKSFRFSEMAEMIDAECSSVESKKLAESLRKAG